MLLLAPLVLSKFGGASNVRLLTTGNIESTEVLLNLEHYS